MRVALAAVAVAAATPGAARPVLAQPAPRACQVTIARAPDDARRVIEAWVRAEPRCTTSLELRVVPTDGGLYLFARDDRGRIHERIVPDAQSAGVLVASWIADDRLSPGGAPAGAGPQVGPSSSGPVGAGPQVGPSSGGPVGAGPQVGPSSGVAGPPMRPDPAIDRDPAVGGETNGAMGSSKANGAMGGVPDGAIGGVPGASPAPELPRGAGVAPMGGPAAGVGATTSAAAGPRRWLTLGGMLQADGISGGGLRGEFDVFPLGRWALGIALAGSTSDILLDDVGTYVNTVDTRAVATLSYTHERGKWQVRGLAGLGVVRTTIDGWVNNSPQNGSAAFPMVELSAMVGRELRGGWAIAAGPVFTIYKQEMFSANMDVTIVRDGEVMAFAGVRKRL